MPLTAANRKVVKTDWNSVNPGNLIYIGLPGIGIAGPYIVQNSEGRSVYRRHRDPKTAFSVGDAIEIFRKKG